MASTQEGRGVTRRAFLRRGAAVAAAPYVLSASVLGREAARPPNDRIVMGSIGVGGRGRGDTQVFLASSETQVVAVCDVDRTRCDRVKKMVDDHYAAQRGKAGYRGCLATGDFREVLARDDIDAVMIATPDHWHALLSVLAARAGKDIYCEKPMSVTVAEGRVVADTMARLGRIYQSGTQRRSVSHFRFACELVRNRRIGELERIVEMLQPGPTCGPQPVPPVPKGFDYDRWLGPAPWAPYTPRRCHGSFRFVLDYSDGKISDQGAHFIDIGQWANDTEDTGPVAFEGKGTFPADGLFNTPVTYHVTCTYASGVEMVLSHETVKGDWAIRFEGTDGWLLVTRHKLLASRPALTEPLRSNEIHLRRSDHHWQNFLDAVRTRTQPIAPAHILHRSHSICHLALICLRLGRTLRWDPGKERFVGDPAADQMLDRAHREPWIL